MCGSTQTEHMGPRCKGGAYLCVCGEGGGQGEGASGQQDTDPKVWGSQKAGGRALPFGSTPGAKGASSCAQECGGGGF